MPRILLVIAALALAGCPPKGPQSGEQTQSQVVGPGCPSASGVYLASYATAEGGKGRTGWVMPLHSMKIEPGANVPDYAPLDPTTASASGVPPAPTGTLWLIAGGAQPCRAQLGSYYTSKQEGPPANIGYGIELQGCPAPSDPQEGDGIVLVSNDAPTGCRFEQPRPVAARLGQPDAQKQWQRPTQATPIPQALGALIPAHDCQAPRCEQLWAFAEVDINNQPVAWTGAVNWLTVGDPAAPCTWKADRFSGTFVPGPGAAPVKLDDAAEHALSLLAVLADGGGAKVLIAAGPGEYATYDAAPGKPVLGHRVTWMLASNDAWEAVDHLGPICEPPAAKPAPLPKDAKPVSPYP